MESTMPRRKFPDISAFGLHLLAMALMVCDHTWATLPFSPDWLHVVGRIAFPVFAFLMAEGHVYTSDVKRYRKRLLLLAVVTEIPFNLICSGSATYPLHQNVIWTFLLASVCIGFWQKAQESRTVSALLSALGMTLVGYLAGYILFVDYYGEGVLMAVMFYLLRGSRWYHRLGQAAALYWINVEMLKGRMLLIPLLGSTVEFPVQGFALLALIPIWLYRGRQGLHSKAVRLVNYGFYPAHMLVLWLVAMVLD